MPGTVGAPAPAPAAARTAYHAGATTPPAPAGGHAASSIQNSGRSGEHGRRRRPNTCRFLVPHPEADVWPPVHLSFTYGSSSPLVDPPVFPTRMTSLRLIDAGRVSSRRPHGSSFCEGERGRPSRPSIFFVNNTNLRGKWICLDAGLGDEPRGATIFGSYALVHSHDGPHECSSIRTVSNFTIWYNSCWNR